MEKSFNQPETRENYNEKGNIAENERQVITYKKVNVKHYGNLRKQNTSLEIPWIKVGPKAPFFVTDTGEAWTPIGQNDAIIWPDFANAFRRKDMKQVEAHLAWLADHGVNCLRFMLEYAQTQHRYFEQPVGKFPPNMVQLWDDLFYLCAKYGLRLLLTPFDTFWMWIRWKHHPYNKNNGGPCKKRSNFLLCPDSMAAIKNRLTFATERWGGNGVIFAWDLWNEIHPAFANNRTDGFYEFVKEISQHLRSTEEKLYGRSHLQTVSLYGPVLDEHPQVADIIFRHPDLDFANNHFYDTATINKPKNTIAPAICTGKLVREALQHIQGNKPFFDSEHGPIHTFKDKHITLPEHFDDEYFRHMQWAHFASGAAGGGMRWPNRQPHCLTHGMRRAQKNLADFTNLLDWKTFLRKNMNEEVTLNSSQLAVFACADKKQALVWLVRKDTIQKDGTLNAKANAIGAELTIPGLEAGDYRITSWNTKEGFMSSNVISSFSGGNLTIPIENIVTDIALAVRKTV